MRVMIVKEVMTGDVSPVAMFYSYISASYSDIILIYLALTPLDPGMTSKLEFVKLQNFARSHPT